jgi:hypothetical protein
VIDKPERPYLDERSLGRFLRERLDSETIANALIPSTPRRFRPDYRSERHRVVVEFDGDEHYRRALHVIQDAERDDLVAALGYRVIRIPYFVQLTTVTINQLFGALVANQFPFKEFPHGFIARTVIFPADFCELGIERFQRDLDRFASIKVDILTSLQKAATDRGDWRLVYPPKLREWLGLSVTL